MRFLILICFIFSLIACGDSGDPDAVAPDFSPKQPKFIAVGAPPGDWKAYAHGVAEFGFELFKQLDNQPGNLVFSPYGIHRSIGILAHGMDFEAGKRLRLFLGFDLPALRHHGASTSVIDQLFKDGKELEHFHVGAALWLQDGLTFQETYLRQAVDFHAQQLYASDFQGDVEQVTEDINDWIAQQTGDRVERVVEDGEIDAQTTLVSTHVVSMESPWHYAFDKAAIRDLPFQLSGHQAVAVPTMRLTANLPFVETPNWKMVYLPYRDGKFGMFILVPKNTDGLTGAMGTLDGKEFAFLKSAAKSHDVALSLPRFGFTTRINVADSIKAMGMPEIFDSAGGAFSRIIEESVAPVALHVLPSAAGIEVNDAGDVVPKPSIEAKGDAGAEPKGSQGLVEMRCDQPFIFLVQHRATSTLILAGRVSDPRKDGSR